MIQDIMKISELYLKSLTSKGFSWREYHDRISRDAALDDLSLLVDATIDAKYVVFINVDTQSQNCQVGGVKETTVMTDEDRFKHLFWRGSGGAKSDNIRNTPHKLFSTKKDFSTRKMIKPLKTIFDQYCTVQKGKKRNKEKEMVGPLFWDRTKTEESEWMRDVIYILEKGEKEIDDKVKRDFPTLKPGESLFVVLTINDKPVGDYELFRRYLLFVKLRAGIKGGSKKFCKELENKKLLEVSSELKGICPSCGRDVPLLNQWSTIAELSLYQLTDLFHRPYEHPGSSFKLCQACSDLLYVFKQWLLRRMTKRIGGNECLVLPSIKLFPTDRKNLRGLYQTLTSLWDASSDQAVAGERRLMHRLGQLPSYATVSFIFGDAITTGESQNVRRMDKLNLVFPDVLPSRLSKIAMGLELANKRLDEIWASTHSTKCPWSVQDDFYVLYELFHPPWEEKKKQRDKSRRRPEMERYLHAIFYGEKILPIEVAADCQPNLVDAFKKMRKSEKEEDRYAISNYMGRLLTLYVFLDTLEEKKEVRQMSDFKFIQMPKLGEFVAQHPLLRRGEFLSPFFVGCVFSYAEHLQKKSKRLAAYNWLGTLALSYDDILQGIYPKSLEYIKNKEKIVGSPRLQELMKAICHYDQGRCENDRVATVTFCHGWAVGRDFIFKPKGGEKDETGNSKDEQRSADTD